MKLYVNGQDIGKCILGLERDTWHFVTFPVGPEAYLATLESFLQEQGVSREDVDGIVVVQGPGSATALRTSLAIVNTWHFVRQIPLTAVQKERDVPDETCVSSLPDATTTYVMPVYEHAPRITTTSKDQLRRQQ